MIDILLAAYNGERYISEQIESVLAQDCDDFTLRICDDCSTDRTPDIIRRYAKRHPGKIIFTQNEKNSGCAAENFFKLLYSSDADYIMFCDQDDVWFKNKISLSLELMKNTEALYGKDMPVLLHTDLTVTDSELNVIARSMFDYQHLCRDERSAAHTAVQNTVTGCTMMLNRTLADRLRHTPVSVPVHDWWIALYTACCGKTVFCNEPTLFYRQHKTNICGAQNMSDIRYITQRAAEKQRSSLMIKYGYRQAAEMAGFYGSELGEENCALLKGYGELEKKPYLKRLAYVLRHGLLKSGIARKLGQLLYL